MKKTLPTLLVLLGSGTGAFAGGAFVDPVSVPEAGVTGSFAAIAAVAVVGAIAWERRRRNRRD